MVVLALDQSLSVTITREQPSRCAYTVVFEGVEVAGYTTSADPRTAGGRIGLRNVIRKNVPAYEKSAVGERLAAEIDAHTEELADELGPRETK